MPIRSEIERVFGTLKRSYGRVRVDSGPDSALARIVTASARRLSEAFGYHA